MKKEAGLAPFETYKQFFCECWVRTSCKLNQSGTKDFISGNF